MYKGCIFLWAINRRFVSSEANFKCWLTKCIFWSHWRPYMVVTELGSNAFAFKCILNTFAKYLHLNFSNEVFAFEKFFKYFWNIFEIFKKIVLVGQNWFKIWWILFLSLFQLCLKYLKNFWKVFPFAFEENKSICICIWKI